MKNDVENSDDFEDMIEDLSIIYNMSKEELIEMAMHIGLIQLSDDDFIEAYMQRIGMMN